MNRFTKISVPRYLCLLAIILFGAGLLSPDSGWGHFSGLSLNIYRVDQNSEYFMDEEIGLIGIIKNETQWPINTNRGMREIEIEQFLIATDPFGVKHVAVQEGDAPEDMQPTPSWGELETVPADVLESGYTRSVKIKDLRTLFPTMQEIPGEWKLQAVVTISRFLYTVKTAEGLSGVLDSGARQGTLESNQLRIMIVPAFGARLRIRVEDISKKDITAQSHVPVRIYKIQESIIEDDGFSAAETWKNLDPLVSGETDQGGWVTLPTGASCLPQPGIGEAYLALAGYEGKYRAAVFENDADGWMEKCSGRLERYIFFNEKPQEMQTFSVFGLNSVRLKNKVRIKSGDVGAQAECSSCVLPNVDVALDDYVWVADGATIKGDRVHLDTNASVWNVESNELTGSGLVRGKVTTSLDLPVWGAVEDFFPSGFYPAESQSSDVNVESREKKTLYPGEGMYHDVTVDSHAILFLDPGDSNPGVFHFNNLTLNAYTAVVCRGPSEIRIKGKLLSNGAEATYLGPAARSGLRAEDVVVYVMGSEQAVVLGRKNWIRANIFAKNGNLETDERCLLAGSFIARNITIGEKSVVIYDGAFSEPIPGAAITLTATARKIWSIICYADLAWEGASTPQVDIYRNGSLRKTTTNDGIYSDYLGWWVSGEFEYKICDQGTSTCSEPVTVTF